MMREDSDSPLRGGLHQDMPGAKHYTRKEIEYQHLNGIQERNHKILYEP